MDFIDESEVLRRVGEGAAMIRTKGEAGTGDVVEAVRHMRTLMMYLNAESVFVKEKLAGRGW